MGSVLWHAGRGAALFAKIGNHRLQVEALEKKSDGARYLVFRDGGPDEPGSLIGSGNAESVRDAMEKAEQIAFVGQETCKLDGIVSRRLNASVETCY